MKPPPLYASIPWRIALILARGLPAAFLSPTAQGVARAYAAVARNRRQVVVNNLLPLTAGNRGRAEKAAGQMFGHFARKLVDLWRYEAGADINSLLAEPLDSAHLEKATKTGRGILMVTVHLGNWEFGVPLLQERNLSLLAVTQEEPDPHLTRLRERARQRRGVETAIISNDTFGFVKLVRHLEDGGIAAMLVDRPSPSTAVTVEFFDRPFKASIAVAELARATGAIVLPVVLPWTQDGYQARVFPPVEYDRASLRDPAHRMSLTQRTIHVFESSVHEHMEQWFHFVPVWEP